MKTLVYFASGQYYPEYEALPYDRVILIDSYLHAPDPLHFRSSRANRTSHAPLTNQPIGTNRFGNQNQTPDHAVESSTSASHNEVPIWEQPSNSPRRTTMVVPANPPEQGDFDMKVCSMWSLDSDPNCRGRKDRELLDLEDHIFGWQLIEDPHTRHIWKRGKVEGWKMDCWEALKLFPTFGVTIDCFVCVNEGMGEGGGRYYINSKPFLRESAAFLAKDYIHVLASPAYHWEDFLPGFLDTRKEIHEGDEGWLDARPLMHFSIFPVRAFRRIN